MRGDVTILDVICKGQGGGEKRGERRMFSTQSTS